MPITLLQLLALPLAVLAQQTQELFVDSEPDQEWAASVVGQDACGTTLDLACTAGTVTLPGAYGTIECNPSGFESGFAMVSDSVASQLRGYTDRKPGFRNILGQQYLRSQPEL